MAGKNPLVLKEELVAVGLEAADAADALRQMGQRFVEGGYAKRGFPEALVEREAKFPTALPAEAFDVAIPHCDASYLEASAVGIATLARPVEMRMMGDDQSVLHPKVLFVLGIAEPHEQVSMLQRVIEIIQDKQALENIYGCEDPHELWRLIAPRIGA